jgi:hypothetical protein
MKGVKTFVPFVVALLLPATALARVGDDRHLVVGQVVERRPDIVTARGCIRYWGTMLHLRQVALDAAGRVVVTDRVAAECPPRADRWLALPPSFAPGEADVCEPEPAPMRRLALADGSEVAAYPFRSCAPRSLEP